jgi:protoheme IX farnesyltransferase
MTPLRLDQAAVVEAPPFAAATPRRLVDHMADYVSLMKPRIVLLLLITGYCAMVVAAHGLPSWRAAVWTTLGLALSAGGANAINMWFDRDIDPLMARTRHRPLPSGRLLPAQALLFGIACELMSLPVLAWGANWLAALLSLGGFLYYVFIYTMWLKRRTPQNIVIGGGAGAFPPLVGWAAVTGSVGLAAVLMFCIIFFWTPPHFWSLALYRQEDYRRAGIPMMPVARGERTTKWQSLLYAVLLLPASLALYGTHAVGGIFLVASLALGLGFVAMTVALLRQPDADATWAKRTFRYSLLYLTAVFAVMVLDVRPL